jgi:hypothetical protein
MFRVGSGRKGGQGRARQGKEGVEVIQSRGEERAMARGLLLYWRRWRPLWSRSVVDDVVCLSSATHKTRIRQGATPVLDTKLL